MGRAPRQRRYLGQKNVLIIFLVLPCTIQCPCVLGMGSKFLQMMVLRLSKRVLEFAVRSLD